VNHGEIVSWIWGVADLIRDTFKRGKYQDVILPLTVLRRLDCVLGPTKTKVLAKQAELRDTESVPLSEPVETFFEREVKPHVEDAWIDTERRDPKDGEIGLIGYEINFNRYSTATRRRARSKRSRPTSRLSKRRSWSCSGRWRADAATAGETCLCVGRRPAVASVLHRGGR
jgi:hypothetical protein